MKSILFFLCTLCTIYFVGGYHILVVFPVPSRSHNTLGKGVVDSLLNAGHQVTWVTPFPPKDPVKELTIIDVSATVSLVPEIDLMNSANVNKGLAFVKNFSRSISRTAITTPALRNAIINGKYDAVVTEAFFSDVDAGYAAVLQVPWIILNGVAMMPNMEKQLDDVRSITTTPLMFNLASIPMNLYERLVNTFFYVMMTLDGWWDHSTLVTLYESLFASIAAARGVPLPAFTDAFYNVSVLFTNSHASFSPAVILPPNVIEVAGYHIPESIPPLPKDLQDLLDASKQGVIYFSMGSVLKSAGFPEQLKRELLQVFSKLPFTVLWKFEEQLDNLPKNVHVRPWMPQASILAHPNVKLFITHGGLLSTLETLRYGVPQVVIPMFGDQPANAFKAVQNGYARQVTFSHSMAGDIKEAIDDMMRDDKYYKQAKYLSKLFNNRPVSPSKLISHYIEVAIESKGAFHLRSKSLLYSWYQRCALDQLAVLLAVIYVIYRLIKAGINKCIGKTNSNKLKKNYLVFSFFYKYY